MDKESAEKMIDKPLDFFVVGAQKCATSWLYYCLRDHPAIRLPRKKIENGYLGGAMFHENGADWYFSRFHDASVHTLNGDVAVDYLLDPAVPTQLGPYTRDPKFVALVRNPVDRLVSAYYWSLRKNQIPNEPLAKHLVWFADQAPGFPVRHPDRYIDELVRRAFYGEQLQSYLDTLDPERFLVVLYDEVKEASESVIQRVYHHIGADDTFEPPSLRVRPKVNTRNKATLALERMSNGKMLARVADRLNRVIASVQDPKPEMTAAMRAHLMGLFRPHLEHTETVLAALPESNRPKTIRLTELWD